MNSPSRKRSWIVSTCRGRVQHLRDALPSWLDRLPEWDPIVVCCDDPQATEYVAGELMLARRGICVSISQGQHFNKLEAVRIGVGIAACGVEPTGQTISQGPLGDWICLPDSAERIALLDADTVATTKTAELLEGIGAEDVAICGWGTRDDLGFLVASVGTVWAALGKMPVGKWEGYGPEDASLRVACWALVRKPFVLVPAFWARRTHSDRDRTRYHRLGMSGATRANKIAQGELMAALIAPEDLPRCRADALIWPRRFSEYARDSRI